MLVVRGSAPLRPSDPISTSKLIRYFVAEWHDLDTLHGRRAPYAPGKIYLYAGRVGLGICKPYHTRPGSGGKLRFYTVVVEHDRIAVYAGPLPVMRKPAAIAAFRIIFSAFECFQRPHCRHNEEIAQIAIPPHSAHMGKTESLYGFVVP